MIFESTELMEKSIARMCVNHATMRQKERKEERGRKGRSQILVSKTETMRDEEIQGKIRNLGLGLFWRIAELRIRNSGEPMTLQCK
jgi:hypothetical protein